MRFRVKFLFIFISLFGLGSQTFGMSPDEHYLEGNIKSFSKEEVRVLSGNAVWTIPRKLLKQKQLISNQPVRILLTSKELNSFKYHLLKK